MLRNFYIILSLFILVIGYQNCNSYQSAQVKSTDLSSSNEVFEDSQTENLEEQVLSPPVNLIEDGSSNEVDKDGHVSEVDPAITTNNEALKLSNKYEDIFHSQFSIFLTHTMDHFNDPDFTDADAKAKKFESYSSGAGWGTYHTLDEILALAKIIYVTKDEARLDTYSNGAFTIIERAITAMVTGEGTEECTKVNKRFRCGKGRFRFLDASHGLGSTGALLLAMYDNPYLNAKYKSKIVSLARRLSPITDQLSFYFKDETMKEVIAYPHMVSKSAPGYYAIGIILDKQNYIDTYWKHIEYLVKSIEGEHSQVPKGWVGADVSHANITVYNLVFAYQEKLRRNKLINLTKEHLTSVGNYYPKQLASDNASSSRRPIVPYYRNGNLSTHALFVNVSSEINEIYLSKSWYQTLPSGKHPRSSYFSNIASLAMGFALNID